MVQEARQTSPQKETLPKAVNLSWSMILIALVMLGLVFAGGAVGLGIAFGALAGMLLGLGFLLWFFRGSNLVMPDTWQEGYRSLILHTNSGEYDAAESCYLDLLPKTQKHAYYLGLLQQVAGVLYFRKGDPLKSFEMLSEALVNLPQKDGRLIKLGDLLLVRSRVHSLLAEVHAVLDNTVNASKALDDARATAQGWSREELRLAEVLIQCRQGRFVEAAHMDLTDWFRLEGVLPQRQMKLHRLLRAFALSKLETTPARNEEVRMLLEGVRPCVPNEFNFLCGRWPELKAFLVQHGLSA